MALSYGFNARKRYFINTTPAVSRQNQKGRMVGWAEILGVWRRKDDSSGQAVAVKLPAMGRCDAASGASKPHPALHNREAPGEHVRENEGLLASEWSGGTGAFHLC